MLVTVYYVLKYSGDCGVVMPWWVVVIIIPYP